MSVLDEMDRPDGTAASAPYESVTTPGDSETPPICRSHILVLDEGLSVHIPVRQYEVTLKHRVLAQLGGFSHLLLDALHQMPESGVDWVLGVTGLRRQQLQPILSRLDGLGLLTGMQLSPKGQVLLDWKCRLHGWKRSIWLDGDYRKHCFCGDSSIATVPLQDDTPCVIHPGKRQENTLRPWPVVDWNEDCERQRQRIMQHPEHYLPPIFEHFTDCFHKTRFNSLEWELTVRLIPDTMEPRAIAVSLDAGDLKDGNGCDYAVASPVLCLLTRYGTPANAPTHLRGHRPSDQFQMVIFQTSDDPIDPIDPDDLSDTPPGYWVWPRVDPESRETVIGHLFREIAPPDDETERQYNREHLFTERWRCLGFNWLTIEERLVSQGIHRVIGEA